MSTLTATIILLAANVAVFVLLLWAFLKPRMTVPVLSSSGALLLGVMLYHANPFARPAVDSGALVLPNTATQMVSRCQEILTAVQDAGIILDKSNPAKPVVSRQIWRQVPQTVQRTIESCLEETRSDRGTDSAIEIIEL